MLIKICFRLQSAKIGDGFEYDHRRLEMYQRAERSV